ncbi:energy-coupled thiamine transporter ThiT [Tuberibacillus sp. Marseille-P3662]|uniref:energy-coupled thiamine transporter ThiT n=1 Tax=Tuberibacillus sp. Marseille-P3662 TaxID=1965358 RepID=UPI000A1C7B81|nr:energy-coupled thiamine transporter ThiT [Tuberibacillus sp. Marseille-P3662]
MKNMRLHAMIEAAILASMAMVLDLLPSIQLTAGISISFSMIPVFVVALRWGFRTGMLSGLLWGVLQVVLGDATILYIVQAFIEYLIAFPLVGVAGLFVYKVQQQIAEDKKRPAVIMVLLAIFLGSFARYFCHFIAGVYFFDQYAPENMSAVWYSFVINGTTMILTFILCAIVMSGLILVSPRFLVNRSLAWPDRGLGKSFGNNLKNIKR